MTKCVCIADYPTHLVPLTYLRGCIPGFFHMAQTLVDRCRPDLAQYEEIYKKLHANPELSDLEEETAGFIEDHLIKLSPDLEIKTKIGGFGLIAICKNGGGKTTLLRADMDALPVAEMTGLDYASQKKMKDVNGDLKPVMHGKLGFSELWEHSEADKWFTL